MKFENLMTWKLEGAEGVEVVMSRVTVPAGTKLPKHWHPGEEFAYVLDGKFVYCPEGEEEVTIGAGEIGAVPFKKVHTIRTEDEEASMIVFRVHEEGQPERVLVEE